jgi:hypothetical protein
VVVLRGQIRRIGWAVQILEAQVGHFLLGCKCPVSPSIVVQEQDPLGDLPHVQIFMNDGPNALTWDAQLLSYWFSWNPVLFQDPVLRLWEVGWAKDLPVLPCMRPDGITAQQTIIFTATPLFKGFKAVANIQKINCCLRNSAKTADRCCLTVFPYQSCKTLHKNTYMWKYLLLFQDQFWQLFTQPSAKARFSHTFSSSPISNK